MNKRKIFAHAQKRYNVTVFVFETTCAHIHGTRSGEHDILQFVVRAHAAHLEMVHLQGSC